MNWSGIIGALLIFVITLGMVLFLALRELWRKRHCGILGVVFSLFFSAAMLRVMATKPHPGGPAMAPRRDAPSMVAPVDDSTNEVPRAAWETTLAFSAINMTPTNLTVRASCPAGFFDHDVTLDCVASQSLTNSYYWVTNLTLEVGCTNLDFVLTPMQVCGSTNFPPRLFFRVLERASTASTMIDTDRDGLPDIYELRNGTNPYVPDYELAPKIVVGADAVSLSAALESSEPYSVIEIPSGEALVSRSLVFPNYPVLVTGPRDGYSVFRSSSRLGAFMFSRGQDDQTLIRNLYLVLERRGDFQVGFWCGGNLPWSGVGSNPTFQNVVVRTPRPETQYIGWLFYRDNGGVASLSNCLVDASGAVNVRGVETGNGPEVQLQDFSCLNFPTSGIQKLARTFTLGDNGATNQIRQVGLEATVFVDLTPGVDSDGDGYTNEEEVYTLHTNPWLADSDGDGLSDPLELLHGSDPMDVRSFPRKIYVTVTNTTDVAGSSVCVSWGRSGVGIEAMPLTNTVERSTSCEFDVPPSQGNVYVTAFRDLNGNGVFDAEYDIVRSETISDLTEVSHLRFAFGDVDNDGVTDTQERLDGTDPYSSLSLKVNQRVELTNNDLSDSLDTYYFYGLSPLDCVSATYAFIGRSTTFYVSQVVTNRYLYLTVYRDVNCNGVFDAGIDLHSVFSVANLAQGLEASFTIGDTDGDKILDSIELTEGTDPTNWHNYCYHPLPTVQDIFSTTNVLCCQAYLGTNVISVAMVVTNEVMSFDFGHLYTTNSEILTIKFWDDVNGNGTLDADESSSSVSVPPNGHDFAGTYTLAYGGFDSNHNNLPDWWEFATGLDNVVASHGFADDNDGDGLINIHEFWSHTDPLVFDGTNLLLSALSRGIDCLTLGDRHEMRMFDNYPVSLLPPTELTTNSAFFASDVDLSCVSVWNADGYTQKCATAVSPYHVVGAAHWQVAANVNVYFLGRDGVVYSNKVVASRSYEYHYWNSPFSTLDVSVGILATPLPESVGKAKILPIDSLDHLWEGRYLPVLSVNQDRDVYIREISSSILPNTPVGNPYKSATTTSISYGVPSAPARKSYYGQIRSGDSSCPNFFVLNNEPVLLGCNLTASAAPSILLTGGHIQRMMDELSDERSKPRCALQYIDVSSFDAIEIRKK